MLNEEFLFFTLLPPPLFQQSSAKRPNFKTISIKLFSFSLLFFLYIITLTVRTASKVQTSWLLNCWWLWTMECRPFSSLKNFFFGLNSQNMRFCFIMHNDNVLFLVNKYYVSSPIHNLTVSLFVVGLSITWDISFLGFEVFFMGLGVWCCWFWNSNTLSWNVCGCCQEMGALGLFALWGIVSYLKRYQMS